MLRKRPPPWAGLQRLRGASVVAPKNLRGNQICMMFAAALRGGKKLTQTTGLGEVKGLGLLLTSCSHSKPVELAWSCDHSLSQFSLFIYRCSPNASFLQCRQGMVHLHRIYPTLKTCGSLGVTYSCKIWVVYERFWATGWATCIFHVLDILCHQSRNEFYGMNVCVDRGPQHQT